MVLPWGWMGTSQPLDDTQVTTVIGNVFPASQYTIDEIDKVRPAAAPHRCEAAHLRVSSSRSQCIACFLLVRQAHADYCSQLKELYDTYKDRCGMGDRPFVLIGKDFYDKDIIPQVFRRLGVHTSHVIPNTTQHRIEVREIAEQKRLARKKRLEALEAEREEMLSESD
jgi:hypothetical protein